MKKPNPPAGRRVLVCLLCRCSVEVEDSEHSGECVRTAKARGFEVNYETCLMFGTCRNCQSRSPNRRRTPWTPRR
mgnify:CR=1 FL=1